MPNIKINSELGADVPMIVCARCSCRRPAAVIDCTLCLRAGDDLDRVIIVDLSDPSGCTWTQVPAVFAESIKYDAQAL